MPFFFFFFFYFVSDAFFFFFFFGRCDLEFVHAIQVNRSRLHFPVNLGVGAGLVVDTLG